MHGDQNSTLSAFWDSGNWLLPTRRCGVASCGRPVSGQRLALLLEMLQALGGCPAGSGPEGAQQGCLLGTSGPLGQEEGVSSQLCRRFTPRNFIPSASMPWWGKEGVLAEQLRAAAPVCPRRAGPWHVALCLAGLVELPEAGGSS